MAQQTVAAPSTVKEEPLEVFLGDVGMTEEEFDMIVEQSFRELEEGKTSSFEQLKRECGLA